MYRSHTCGELRINDKGKSVQLAGWVQTIRKYGSITFVDLRDRYGITQLLFGESVNAQLDEQPLGREFVLQVQGKVIERSNKNLQIPTGEIEIEVNSFTILNRSAVPPFTIQDDTDGGDDLRMKYRFLDLRRAPVRKNLELRYAVNRAARNYLHQQSFLDIETPFLIKSTLFTHTFNQITICIFAHAGIKDSTPIRQKAILRFRFSSGRTNPAIKPGT